MAKTGIEDIGYLGRYVKTYRPRPNAHRLLNDAFGLPPRRAFPPSAVIVQQKKIPDVSFYQGEIDWAKMRALTDALIIRAGQRNWIDTKFKVNWQEAKEAGILRGSYWFYDDRESPGKQAEIWAELLHQDPPEMEIWADWENTYGGSFGGLRNVVAFMQAMERFLPSVEIGMYTGYWWFREHSNAVTNAGQYDYLKRRKLFEAYYTSNAASVLIPNPWTEMYLWQFGTPAVGKEYGVETAEIDMSFINMTEAEFQQRYRGVGTPPPETGENMQGTVKNTVTRGLNVRDANGNVVAALRYDFATLAGDVVYGEVKSDNRIYFNKIYRSNGLVQNLGSTCSAIIREGTSEYLALANVAEPGTETPPPSGSVKVPFTLTVDGYKPYSGELEKA